MRFMCIELMDLSESPGWWKNQTHGSKWESLSIGFKSTGWFYMNKYISGAELEAGYERRTSPFLTLGLLNSSEKNYTFSKNREIFWY